MALQAYELIETVKQIDPNNIPKGILNKVYNNCLNCKHRIINVDGTICICIPYISGVTLTKVYCVYREKLLLTLLLKEMELAEFTTEELREELKRRAKEARINARKKKPEYIEIIGVVTRITNNRKSFMHNQYTLDIKDNRVRNCDKLTTYTLKTGKFKKDNYPQVGDTVILKQRLTKAINFFIARYAKIDSIVKRKKE